jgi:transposase-like protein
MLQFPLDELLDEQVCHDFLLRVLHPEGLHCPHVHRLPVGQAPHDRHRAPILDERCRTCGAVFNLFTDTIWAKRRYRCSTSVQILRGIAHGVPTKQLAEELGLDRGHVLARRHRIQSLLAGHLSPLGATPG